MTCDKCGFDVGDFGEMQKCVNSAQDELETERMRLAACGVAAMGNTAKTAAQRIDKDNPYYSASYGDVCAAVDREMKYRRALQRCWAALDDATEGFDARKAIRQTCEEALLLPEEIAAQKPVISKE